MSDFNQEVKDLAADWEKIKESLDLPKKRKRLAVLSGESAKEDFWDDQETARGTMQELGDLKKELEEAEVLGEELDALVSLAKEGSGSGLERDLKKLHASVNKLKISSFLSGPYDHKNAIVSIHAGQGGVEAMDWAGMLYRMYLRYCEKCGWRVETINTSQGEEAGIKSVTFKVNGTYAYGYLKGEGGTHRLVRQSPFNADKLRQTSFALVEVLPELAEVDLPDIKIIPDELEWQFFRASSQGGQNVQKVSSAVRLTHKPTAIVVTAQTERYQEQNRKYALDLLRAKLWVKRQEELDKQKSGLKGTYVPASWGTQIRSYVLHPYKMVKDLRTKVETSDAEAVLDGELDKFVQALVVGD
ncbi:peptide chain release factor 2 [Candidatus Woesebacteria bacterium GWB1_43_5]|uniref:Peptide chain release factor 2 n=1 Tax=Candidatus Woesebacteria bacterium GWB1_43_5 TaxID=1802474 RepID=A0A1F7WTG0_9BACT|nr:MAG: peptide chain release factor 2 [Candidatus Woesebacteria bacterium GWB1_43_5]